MKANTMQYISVEWIHTLPDEPVFLYYELDADRHEQRKVEEYRDGTLIAADAAHGPGSTFLAWEPHPPLADIEADPQFRVRQISPQAFERVWNQARLVNMQPAA